MSYGFDWDKSNLAHIARHGVSPEEAEQVMFNDPLDVEQLEVDGEMRILQIGITDNLRCLAVATTWRDDLLRVVTAYPATRSAEQYYWKNKGGQ